MSRNIQTRNDMFPQGNRSRRRERLSIAFTLLVCAGLLLGIPDALYAGSFATSTISFSDLQITASSGAVQLSAPWSSQASADAQNSLGELDSEFTSNTGAASTIGASVTYANASGTANVSPLSGSASGAAGIPAYMLGQAITTGTGALFNSFEVTGTTGTGPVNVTFSTDLIGLLQAENTGSGVLATAEATFLLDVNGTPYLFFDSPISVGPDASQTAPFCYGTTGCSQSDLTNTVSLNFNTPYSVYVETDAETSAYNATPEPPASILFITLLGIAAYACMAERRAALGKRA